MLNIGVRCKNFKASSITFFIECSAVDVIYEHTAGEIRERCEDRIKCGKFAVLLWRLQSIPLYSTTVDKQVKNRSVSKNKFERLSRNRKF